MCSGWRLQHQSWGLGSYCSLPHRPAVLAWLSNWETLTRLLGKGQQATARHLMVGSDKGKKI